MEIWSGPYPNDIVINSSGRNYKGERNERSFFLY